jgi:hypothetical protein
VRDLGDVDRLALGVHAASGTDRTLPEILSRQTIKLPFAA